MKTNAAHTAAIAHRPRTVVSKKTLKRALRSLAQYLVLGILGIVWVVPFLWIISAALKSPAEATSNLASWFTLHPTLSNFKEAWDSAPFLRYYFNSTVVVVGIVALQFFTATLAAYAFARVNFVGKELFFGLFLLQMMLPAPVLIFPNYNTVNALGLIDHKFGIMLPYVASAFGTFFLRQAFRSVPKDLEDAAIMDGSRLYHLLRHIYVPLSRPFYTAFGLVAVIFHWNEFLWPLIVTNTPQSRVVTVGLASFTQYSEGAPQLAVIAAGTLIVVLPLLIVFVLFQRQFIESFITSGIKG